MDREAIKKLLERNKRDNDSSPKRGDGGGDIRFGGVPYSGHCIVRFLPNKDDSGIPGKLVSTHGNIPEIEKVKCFKMYDMECPLCKLLEDYDGRVKLDDWIPVKKGFINALYIEDTGDKPIEKGVPYVFGLSSFQYENFLEYLISPMGGDITDPETGRDIQFTRKKAGGPLDRQIGLNARPIADTKEGIQAILDQRYDLDGIWKQPTEKAVKTMNLAVNMLKRELDSRVKDKSKAVDKFQKKVDTSFPKKDENTVDDLKQAEKAKEKKGEKPAGAPDCFGNKDIYSNKREECGNCALEFNCASTIEMPF